MATVATLGSELQRKGVGGAEGDWRLGFASLETETFEPRPLEVVGQVPREIDGTLYRIGPARFDVYGERFRHWFDGDGMVHALSIGGGEVTYRNRFVATPGKAEEDSARRRIFAGFGTPSPGGFWARFRARSRLKNPANTNIVRHAGKLLALCEGGRPYELDPVTLETRAEDSLGVLGERDTFSAHPKLDRATGEMWNFGVAYGARPEIHLYRTSAAGVTERVATIPMPLPAMVHDFALTPTKIVFILAPVSLPTIPVGLMLGQSSFGGSLRYRPELGTKIAVFDRDTKEVRWLATDPFLMFHTVHAWDEGGDAIVDLCAYPDGRFLRSLVDVMAGTEVSPSPANVERLRLRADGAVVRSRPSAATMEFPRAAGRAFGREPRRIYGVTWAEDAPFLNQPVAADLARGTIERAPMGRGEFAGEGVLVMKPGATDESDAWLLSLVLDAPARRSELRIFEAADLTAPPVGRVRLPWAVPFGFHGSFVPRAG